MILSQLTAELTLNSTPDASCSPSPAFNSESQDHKMRDRKEMIEHLCAASAVKSACILSSWDSGSSNFVSVILMN